MSRIDLGRHLTALDAAQPLRVTGRILELTGMVIEAAVAGVRQGECVEIQTPARPPLPAEVVGLRDDRAMLMPLGDAHGIGLDSEVIPSGRPLSVRVGAGLLGRVVNALGHPLDGRPLPRNLTEWPIDHPAPSPLSRRRVAEALPTGIRAIDAFLTLGAGQRIGLFAGSGVGKSTLLGQIARATHADVTVIALVGERGREVRDFVEDALGPEGLARSVVVAATSDAPALLRLKAAQVATAIAEWFADTEGRSVLFMLDSITRFARAQREVGLAVGEPPARQGYPPSVFGALARLVERTGNRERGGITALYTVLVAGGDMDEPIADEVRGILDGHVVLDRRIAARNRFPAVDVLASVSRVMAAVVSPEHLAAAARVRDLLAAYERQRDLIALGAYRRGSDARTDEAIARIDAIEGFLCQATGERAAFEDTVARLGELAS